MGGESLNLDCKKVSYYMSEIKTSDYYHCYREWLRYFGQNNFSHCFRVCNFIFNAGLWEVNVGMVENILRI